MERSRSPIRPPSGNEPRSLVGFPTWTRPIRSGTPTPPPRQYPSNFPWSQQVPGASSTPQVALSQQSMMICPGQPGLSQQSVDLSQPTATPGPSWQPQRAPMTTPRPVAHGCGMAGMMDQNQAWPRPSHYSQNTPTPPRTPSQPGLGTTPTRTPSTGGRTISGPVHPVWPTLEIR